jgi:hypothetical protein
MLPSKSNASVYKGPVSTTQERLILSTSRLLKIDRSIGVCALTRHSPDSGVFAAEDRVSDPLGQR